MTMKAGTYYVGDLCYVMHDEWSEVCDLLFEGRDDHGCNGEFTLKDGRKFAIYNTAYGDGYYRSNEGFNVGVDSGSIGCILLNDIQESSENSPSLGGTVEFDEDFRTASDGQTIQIGFVEIYTGYDDYEDEDDV